MKVLRYVPVILLVAWPFASAQNDDKKNPKAIEKTIQLAQILAKGEKADALAKDVLAQVQGLDEIMILFKPRGRGGVGFGPPRGLDGIEYFLTQHAFEIARKPILDKLESGADDIAQLAWRSAAVAEVLGHVDAGKRFGPGKVELWKKQVAGLAAASREAAPLAQAKKSAELLVALQKIHQSCTACHYHFRN